MPDPTPPAPALTYEDHAARTARRDVFGHCAEYHRAATACVASGDFAADRFGYPPHVHFRKTRTAGDPGLAPIVDRAIRAIEGGREACRRWAAAPAGPARDAETVAARSYFETTLLPELHACVNQALAAPGPAAQPGPSQERQPGTP